MCKQMNEAGFDKKLFTTTGDILNLAQASLPTQTPIREHCGPVER